MTTYIDTQPPLGRNFAMAYKSPHSSLAARPTLGVGSRGWEELNREARKLQSEVDVKLAAYSKLCSGFEASYRLRTDSSAGADQHAVQLAQSKAAELTELLQRLSDINDEMSACTDARSVPLGRHRAILQDYGQEFRKVTSTLASARDRVQLMAGSSSTAPLLSVQVQGSTGGLLRERGTIASSTNAIDGVLAQAAAVSTNLIEQRRLFDNITDKVLTLGARFPVINGLLNAIRRKKSKDTLVLAAVIAACLLFTLLYIFAR